VSLPLAEGLELDCLSGPFQPKPFYDSMIFKFIWCLGISTKVNLIVCKLHLGAYEGRRSKAVAKYFKKSLFGVSQFYGLA